MKSFFATDPVSQKGQTNTWLTPLPLIRALGEFDLDPCAYPGHETANRLICWPEDGLKAAWEGRVWLNPPFGREVKVWLKKLSDHGNGIALLFARLETAWLEPYLVGGFFQIKGRVSFLNPANPESTNAGAGNILIPFGRKNIGQILISDLEGRWFQ